MNIMNTTRGMGSDRVRWRSVITRSLSIRCLRPYGHIAFAFATIGLLLFLWAVLAAGMPGGTSRAYEPRAIQDITGIYEGPEARTIVCDDDTIDFNIPGTLIIASQQGESFSGSLDDGEFILNGTVDKSGALSGTYSFQLPPITGGGTFTGQASGDQIQLSFSGTLSLEGETCNLTVMLTGTRSSSTAMADLSITERVSQNPVPSGARITYTFTVTNGGPDDATSILVSEPTPVGVTFATATSSQGQVQSPGPGDQGNVIYLLGTLVKGATATLSLTGNVLAPAGSTLVNSPFVTSTVPDPNLANNNTTLSSEVLGGAIVKLVWDQPAPTAANPTPAPVNLRTQLGGRANAAREPGDVTQQDSCTLTAVKIYKSDQPNVQTIPSNLWQVVAANALQATMSAAPAGSFYVITNLWKCGDALIESGASNETGVPPGPTITKLKVGGKLKANGSGFSGAVQVFVDGVGFVKETVLADSTLIVQKGLLTDGSLISDIGATKSALITIRNGDGGLGSFTYKRP